MQPRLWTINVFKVFPKPKTFINFNVFLTKMYLQIFIKLCIGKGLNETFYFFAVFSSYIWGANISLTIYSHLIVGRNDFDIFSSLSIFDTPWVSSYCMVLWCIKGQNIFISAQSFLPTVFASGNIASRCWIRKKQLYGNPPYWMVIELDESLKTKKFLGPKEI